MKRKACRILFLQPVTPVPRIDKNEKGQWTFYPYRSATDVDMNRYHPFWMALWRGNIDVSPVLSKDAAVNYISKYAAKAKPRSAQLDEAIVSLSHDTPADGRIQTILSKALNGFIIEHDFSAQEVCHQVLGLPMVECSHCFDIISLRLDLTVERVFRAGVWRRPNRDAGGLPAAQENSSSKMENYMTDHRKWKIFHIWKW